MFKNLLTRLVSAKPIVAISRKAPLTTPNQRYWIIKHFLGCASWWNRRELPPLVLRQIRLAVQIGIGGSPNAVRRRIRNKRHCMSPSVVGGPLGHRNSGFEPTVTHGMPRRHRDRNHSRPEVEVVVAGHIGYSVVSHLGRH